MWGFCLRRHRALVLPWCGAAAVPPRRLTDRFLVRSGVVGPVFLIWPYTLHCITHHVRYTDYLTPTIEYCALSQSPPPHILGRRRYVHVILYRRRYLSICSIPTYKAKAAHPSFPPVCNSGPIRSDKIRYLISDLIELWSRVPSGL